MIRGPGGILMPLNLIKTVFKYAMFLGLTGHLVDATRAMRGKAFRAHQHGLISLGALNRALMSKPVHKKSTHRH